MGNVEEIREWTLGELGLKKHGVPPGRKNEKESQGYSRGTFSLLSNNTKFIWHTKCNLGHFFFSCDHWPTFIIIKLSLVHTSDVIVITIVIVRSVKSQCKSKKERTNH